MLCRELQIHPNGNNEKGGKDHISIYLNLVETSSLGPGWEVNVYFNFLVYDQLRDKYFSIPDSKVMRFHALKSQWGIAKFIDHDTFNDSSNGYLVKDTCVFGAEVFIIQQSRKLDVLSLLPEESRYNLVTHVWKVKSFSNLQLERYESDAFNCGDYKWRIRIYPNGNGEGKGNSISTFLCLDETTLPLDTKVCANVKFCIKNEDKSANFDYEVIGTHFRQSLSSWGSQKLMSLAKLRDPTTGFLVDDNIVIKVFVTIIGIVTAQ
ncbi:uncharacterized protein LOC124936843 isoform X2 [Impatiens glandulifera]|uniref:uncharacterized protein LOC124936843 isoform X2 n=1 Tax=Impatiens glandulifera TaxID=253017 RepID=UPI001FB0AD42|nr:uncharacterized protein LOC124936843 isoform X2 [Impatiens glandulifera]